MAATGRSPTRAGRLGRAAAWAVGIAALAVVVPAALILSRPLDLGGSVDLPEGLERLSQRDDVGYPAHAALGTVLEQLRFPPEAVGLQWLKAAAHARTPAEVERLGAGLAGTRGRSADPDALDAALCRHIIGGGTLGQRGVIARAQMRCEPHG